MLRILNNDYYVTLVILVIKIFTKLGLLGSKYKAKTVSQKLNFKVLLSPKNINLLYIVSMFRGSL